MKIAATRASGSDKYLMYERWLREADPDVEVVDLHGMSPDQAVEHLRMCAGVVITGGPDVAPDRYGQPEKAELCGPPDLDRDALELAVIQAAAERNMPILGICRGAQILNVAYGGTLIADIPTVQGAAVEHRQLDGVDQRHALHVEGGSLIKRICRVMDGEVNSAHHQAVEYLAPQFEVSARADDGTIEAFEWANATVGGRSFLLAVQWHPERMDHADPLSLPIAQAFTHEAAAYAALFGR